MTSTGRVVIARVVAAHVLWTSELTRRMIFVIFKSSPEFRRADQFVDRASWTHLSCSETGTRVYWEVPQTLQRQSVVNILVCPHRGRYQRVLGGNTESVHQQSVVDILVWQLRQDQF